MSTSELPPHDFRIPAINASLRLLEQRGGADPLTAGMSLCVPTGHSASAMKRQKWFVIGCLVLGFSGLVAAAVLATVEEKLAVGDHNDVWLLASAAVCFVVGFSCLILGVKAESLNLRRHLGERLDELKRSLDFAQLLYVQVEDASTFQKMKLSSENG